MATPCPPPTSLSDWPPCAAPQANFAITVQNPVGQADTRTLLPVDWLNQGPLLCPPGGAILRTTGCGLCGTDVEKLSRRRVGPGTVLGHEVVGVLAYLDPTVEASSDWSVGQRVMVAHHVPCGQCHYCQAGSVSMCRQFKATNIVPGGFSQWVGLSARHLQHTTFAIPDHISDREAACTEPLACVIRGVERIPRLEHQTSAAIVGLGFIGMLAGQTFQQHGLKTLGLDLNPLRLALADVAGLTDQACQPDQTEVIASFLQRHTATGLVDVVCLTVLSEASLTTALSLVRDGGTLLILAGTATDAEVGLPGDVLYHREVSVVTSYSPSLESLQRAHDWIVTRKVRLTPLVTHPLPIEQFKDGVDLYRSGQALKVFYGFPDPSTGDGSS